MTRLACLAAALALAGCRCGPGNTGGIDAGFRLVTEEVDFGRVLEGDRAVRPVTVQNTTRVDLELTLSLESPFSAPATLFLGGGSEETFLVQFLAGDRAEERTLAIESRGGALSLPVRGVGVRPPICVPTAPCRVSAYVLELDVCVESAAPEGSACQTESLCLEKGECRSGQCVGVARTCDDNDKCTVDSCSAASGCVHLPRTCPAPSSACKVATCDPTTGCGEGVAADFTVCGAVDCAQGQFCLNGTCQTATTPEGFLCAGPTPCQGPGTCRSQQCVRPDAGILTPELSVPLLGRPPAGGPQLVSAQGNVYTVLCGAYGADGGADAGGGEADGGADGGADAGPVESCVVASWTGTGFDRYLRPTADGGARWLGGVSQARLALNAGDAVETALASTGLSLDAAALGGTCGPSGVAHDPAGDVWALARDGGASLLWRLPSLDGGGGTSLSLPAPAELLAVDEQGALWAFAPSRGWLGRVVPGDGGHALGAVLDLADAGQAALSTAGGTVAFGARWLSRPEADGGRALSEWPALDDAGARNAWLPRDALMIPGVGAALLRRCEAPLTSCAPLDEATFVVLFDPSTGAERWTAKVLPSAVAAGVVEYAVGRAVIPQAPAVDFVAAAVRVDFDAGTQSYLQVFADGARTVLCPFPDGTALEAATWDDGRMYTLAHRRDGGFFFEAWDMKGAPLSSFGWPKTHGVGGTRQAR